MFQKSAAAAALRKTPLEDLQRFPNHLSCDRLRAKATGKGKCGKMRGGLQGRRKEQMI